MVLVFPDKRLITQLRTLYPPGTRVVLVSMDDPYTNLLPGDKGIVLMVDDAGGVHIQWDKGSTLAAIHGIDTIQIE